MLDAINTVAGGVKPRRRRVIGGAAPAATVVPGSPRSGAAEDWISLEPYVLTDMGWDYDTSPAYYIHRGRVYLRGRLFWGFAVPEWKEHGGPVELIMVLPPAIRPPAPVTVWLPSDYANMSGHAPMAWPTQILPDGTWKFTSYTWPGGADLLPHFPDSRSWRENGEGVLLAAASWQIRPQDDTPTKWVDLRSYINTSYWSPGATVEGVVHGNHAHFRGTATATQEIDGTWASRLFTSLPNQFIATGGSTWAYPQSNVGYGPVYGTDDYIYQAEIGGSLGGALIDLDGYPMATFEIVETQPLTPIKGLPASTAQTVAGSDGNTYVLPQPNLVDYGADPQTYSWYARQIEMGWHWDPGGGGAPTVYWCIGDPTGNFYRYSATAYYPGNVAPDINWFNGNGGIVYRIERVEGGAITLLAQFADRYWGPYITFADYPYEINNSISALYDDYWSAYWQFDPQPGTPKVSITTTNGPGSVVWEPFRFTTHGPVGYALGSPSYFRPTYMRAADHEVRSLPKFYPLAGDTLDLARLSWFIPALGHVPELGTATAVAGGGGIVRDGPYLVDAQRGPLRNP